MRACARVSVRVHVHVHVGVLVRACPRLHARICAHACMSAWLSMLVHFPKFPFSVGRGGPSKRLAMQFIDLAMIAHFVAGSAKAEEASHSPFDDNFRTWGTSLEAIVELILQGPQLDMARLPGRCRPTDRPLHACMHGAHDVFRPHTCFEQATATRRSRGSSPRCLRSLRRSQWYPHALRRPRSRSRGVSPLNKKTRLVAYCMLLRT